MRRKVVGLPIFSGKFLIFRGLARIIRGVNAL